MIGTRNLAVNARNGQATLVIRCKRVRLLHDNGIDKHVRVVVIGARIVGIDNHELNKLANLRSSKAATAVIKHHLLHALSQALDLRPDLGDLGALLAKTRVGRYHDAVYLH